MGNNNKERLHIFVPFRGKGWVVKRLGTHRALRRFDSQISAVAFAVNYSQGRFDVIVHDIYGRVDEWIKRSMAA